MCYQELNTLEGLKRAMTEKCMTAWEELNKLDELKLLLQQDLENKDEAIEIDQYNLGMDKHSACISYKPDALRTPNQFSTSFEWHLVVEFYCVCVIMWNVS